MIGKFSNSSTIVNTVKSNGVSKMVNWKYWIDTNDDNFRRVAFGRNEEIPTYVQCDLCHNRTHKYQVTLENNRYVCDDCIWWEEEMIRLKNLEHDDDQIIE